MRRIRVIDSHTEGEPTRVVVEGGPELGGGSASARLAVLRRDHDAFRAAVVREPRAGEATVGALLAPPCGPDAVAQVIFFNNVGYLGMCVHATIGVARTLRHLGLIGLGTHRLETPAGEVSFTLDEDGAIAVENVRSFRLARSVAVTTARHGVVTGDVAYGGNWFFLVREAPALPDFADREALTRFAWDARCALRQLPLALEDPYPAATNGAGGASAIAKGQPEVDHVALFAPPTRHDAHLRSFVLCPGKSYDRSPCGTGLSAKMACLAEDGELAEGQPWRQESIIGSLFEGRVRRVADGVVPTVTGRAYLTAEAVLMVEPEDPFPAGVGP